MRKPGLSRSRLRRPYTALAKYGGLGTAADADPTEGMAGILFRQRLMESPEPPPLFKDSWTAAYAAME